MENRFPVEEANPVSSNVAFDDRARVLTGSVAVASERRSFGSSVLFTQKGRKR
jgi:hypothetical protein